MLIFRGCPAAYAPSVLENDCRVVVVVFAAVTTQIQAGVTAELLLSLLLLRLNEIAVIITLFCIAVVLVRILQHLLEFH